MNIEEYKKQFIDLFKQLQKEHGKPESVYISTNDICDDTGYVIESKVKCVVLVSKRYWYNGTILERL